MKNELMVNGWLGCVWDVVSAEFHKTHGILHLCQHRHATIATLSLMQTVVLLLLLLLLAYALHTAYESTVLEDDCDMVYEIEANVKRCERAVLSILVWAQTNKGTTKICRSVKSPRVLPKCVVHVLTASAHSFVSVEMSACCSASSIICTKLWDYPAVADLMCARANGL